MNREEVQYIFRTIKQSLLGAVFPIYCLGCKREGEWVCKPCFVTIDSSGQHFCPVCHNETPRGTVCEHGRCSRVLSAHYAMSYYHEDALIGKMIHTLKYEYVESLADILAPLFLEYIQKQSLDQFDAIVAVPLHPKRFAERGFNQAELIANHVSLYLQKPILDGVLIRSRYTRHQAQLNRQERLINMNGAFSVVEESNIVGKRLLLIDDVYTTGATMQSCAKALLKAGAKDVVGLSVARG